MSSGSGTRAGARRMTGAVMRPGYVFMDRGVLHGIRWRAAEDAARVSGSVKGHESDRDGKSHRGQGETTDTLEF
jgi:hypothetical protein